MDGDWKFKDGSSYRGQFKAGRPAPSRGRFRFQNGDEQTGRCAHAGRERLLLAGYARL